MINCHKIIKNCNKGFTLLELMIVIAIIGILAATSIVIFNPGEKQKEQRDALRVSNLSQIASLLELYYAQNKYYPSSLSDLTTPPNELKGVKFSAEDPNPECSIEYTAQSFRSPYYRLVARKESQNFTIPKGQDLVSEIDLPILYGDLPCYTPTVFTITGGNAPSLD